MPLTAVLMGCQEVLMLADETVIPGALKAEESGMGPFGTVVSAVCFNVQVVFGSVVMDSSKVWALCWGWALWMRARIAVVEAESCGRRWLFEERRR
jgi:hypothetical protein